MSGAEIIGVIAGAIGILTAARDAYDSIQDIRGLPETFRQIPPKVDLAVATLDQIHRSGCSGSGAELNTVATLANQCSKNADRLGLVLRKLNLDESTPFPERYVSIIQGWGKKGRVEDLLKNIMEDVMLLANHQMVAATSQGQIRKLEQAVEDLDKVDPSVPDHMLEGRTDVYVGGTGAQNNQIHHTTNTYSGSSSSYAISGPGQNFGNLAGATLNFGTAATEETLDSRCRAALRSRSTDPRHDKARIEKNKDGVLDSAFQWVLHNPEFQRWRSELDMRLLWVKGDPGKGKTMLLCGIINELEGTRDSRPLAYFFCQAADPRINTGTAVLLGLMYFLVDVRRGLLKYLRRSYDDAKEALFQGPNLWIALEGVLFEMLQDPALEDALIIIDALDECQTERHPLLDFISKATVTCPRVKWIVSSRNWPDIEERLRPAEQATRLSLEINEDAVSAAVNAFIHHRVEDLAKSKGLDDGTSAEIENYLSSNAHGTFLWVALVCQALSSIDFPDLIKEHLTCFPPGLEGLYHRMLEQISSSTEASMYRDLLALNLVAYRPLSVHELSSVAPKIWTIASDAGGLAKMLQLCGSLLMIRDNAIFWVHQSARDYLLKHPDFSTPSSVEQAHRRIYQSSLGAMSTTLKRDIYGMIQQHGRLAYGLSVDRLEQQRPKPDPLAGVGYSCIYWADHLRDSRSTANFDDRGDGCHLRQFLETHFMHWLEALSLLRSIHKGVLSMNSLTKLAQGKRMTASPDVPSQRKSVTAVLDKARSRVLSYITPTTLREQPTTSREQPTLADLIRDMWRFLLTFKLPLEQCPLQGYISGPVLSPTESITRSLFLKDRPSWLTEKLALRKTWNNCLQTLEGQRGKLQLVTFSSDGQRLASAAFSSVAFPSATFSSATFSSGNINVWDVASGKKLITLDLDNNENYPPAVAFSPDGCCLAATYYSPITVWDIITGKTLLELNDGLGDLSRDELARLRSFERPVIFSTNGRNLLSVSVRGEVKTWALATGEEIGMFTCSENELIRSAVFSHDGSWLATGLIGGQFCVWDVVEGSKIKSISCRELGISHVLGLSFSHDRKHLVVAGGRKAFVYSFTTEKLKHFRLRSFTFSPRELALSPCGLRLAMTVPGYNISIYRLDKNTHELLTPHAELHGLSSVVFSPDGRQLATGQMGCVRLWDTPTDYSQAEAIPTPAIYGITFSNNLPRAATIGERGRSITVHDLHLGTASKIRCKSTNEVSLSSDGQMMAIAHKTHTTIWSQENGRWVAQRTYRFPTGLDLIITFSPDTRQLAHLTTYISNMSRHVLRLLNVETGQCDKISENVEIHGHKAVVFTENSRKVAVIERNDDGATRIRLWDPLTGGLLIEERPAPADIGIHRVSTLAERGGKFTMQGGPKGAYDISEDGCWITMGGARLLWLPPFCRPFDYGNGKRWMMTCQSAVAFASELGSFFFFEFGEEEG
ncbi:hypothetical protein RB598_005988 [Gaeumannomyces tritici]